MDHNCYTCHHFNQWTLNRKDKIVGKCHGKSGSKVYRVTNELAEREDCPFWTRPPLSHRIHYISCYIKEKLGLPFMRNVIE